MESARSEQGNSRDPDLVAVKHPHEGQTAATVLTQGRGIGHLVDQTQIQEPAIGDVNLDLTDQLDLTAHAEQTADEERRPIKLKPLAFRLGALSAT